MHHKRPATLYRNTVDEKKVWMRKVIEIKRECLYKKYRQNSFSFLHLPFG